VSDKHLAARVLAGEAAAFQEFFEGYAPALYRFALARLGQDADAAEEIVQRTLQQAIRRLATYRGEAALLTWLCTICRHEIGAYLERTRRRPLSIELAEEHPEVRAVLESLSRGGPEETFLRKELARRVHAVLDALPPHYTSVLEWKYLEGLTVKEIAARLDVGAKAAESLLTRAREAFRDGFATLAAAPEGRTP
jgi:RNA polymerase sigma-70 factor (ECF subfamily)